MYFKLRGEGLRSLRIEARQPRYLTALVEDNSAPDFSDCNFDGASHPTDPRYSYAPKQVVLWEDAKWMVVGITQPSFWRPADVDFVVAGRVEKELHFVQLFLKDESAPELGRHEFLVLYPPDGYWRAKPIPMLPLNRSVYGSSFLVGPVEESGRPLVALARVEFVPATLTFQLAYRDGSHGQLKVAEVSREKLALDYTHDRPFARERPMAAIRSMYVTPEKADTAEVTWRADPRREAHTRPLTDFSRERALEVNFGRSVVSRHNASAPDLWFGRFAP